MMPLWRGFCQSGKRSALIADGFSNLALRCKRSATSLRNPDGAATSFPLADRTRSAHLGMSPVCRKSTPSYSSCPCASTMLWWGRVVRVRTPVFLPKTRMTCTFTPGGMPSPFASMTTKLGKTAVADAQRVDQAAVASDASTLAERAVRNRSKPGAHETRTACGSRAAGRIFKP